MADDLPDIAYELKRMAYQRASIEITMLDQRAQLADFVDERKSCSLRIKELQALEVPPMTDDKDVTEGQRLRQQKALLEVDREVLGVEARMAEIDMLERRYTTNITASEGALVELDENMTAMKEAHTNG